MKKIKLSNGMTVVLHAKKSDSIAVHILVKTGSINEDDNNRGVSHFIEHMLFEGTKKRTALQIANEIESLGGTIGAYTSSERTCYHVKVLRKHVDKALDVLSDIIKNPLFDEKAIEKERSVILSEIKLKKDEPRFYQWSLFSRNLLKDSQLKHPVIGYQKTVKSINKGDIEDYFKNHYTGLNMIISVVGELNGIENKIRLKFGTILRKSVPSAKLKKVKIKNSVIKIKEKKVITQTYLILGYIAADRRSRESYVFDVIQAILGRGLSGRIFDELRIKRGLGYDVGSHYEDNKNYGFFAAYATVDKKNLNLAKSIILKQIQDVDKLTEKELKEAKRYIEGEFIINNEDNQTLADTLGFFEDVKDAAIIKEYIKNIKKVTISDIRRVKRKYLKKNNYTMVVLEQK